MVIIVIGIATIVAISSFIRSILIELYIRSGHSEKEAISRYRNLIHYIIESFVNSKKNKK